MANRPFFIPTKNKEELVTTNSVEFTWFSGFAKSQKQKSILSFHENITKEFKLDKILDLKDGSRTKCLHVSCTLLYIFELWGFEWCLIFGI